MSNEKVIEHLKKEIKTSNKNSAFTRKANEMIKELSPIAKKSEKKPSKKKKKVI